MRVVRSEQHGVNGDAEVAQMIAHRSCVAFAVGGAVSPCPDCPAASSVLAWRRTSRSVAGPCLQPKCKDCGVAQLDATAEHHQALVELAEAFNIATDYWDWQGKHVVVALPRRSSGCLPGLGSTHRLLPPPGMPWQNGTGSPGPDAAILHGDSSEPYGLGLGARHPR